MLRLDIVWLLGTAWLARDPSSAAPDWPPEPDRIFSALVASWGAGGEDVGERAALEWLEGLAPPRLVPADATGREAPTVFVPPNDVTASDIRILPSLRRRQPRRFPAVALDADAPCHLRLLWTEEPAPDHLAALNAVACRTSYIGHSTSLVRCRFDTTGERPPEGRPAHRAPYRGRLAELEALHHRHMKGDERARPRPCTRAGASDPAAPPTEGFTADAAHWVVFEHAGGERSDLRAAAILCDTLRVALMESWTKFHGAPAPGWIAGHEADGAPARAAHIAIAPMANVGWNHSDGRLMGLALLPPKAITPPCQQE